MTAIHMLHKAERVLLGVGITLSGFYIGARLHSFVVSRVALLEFDAVRATTSNEKPFGAPTAPSSRIDFSLWDEARITAYQASLALRFDPPLGVLSIPRLKLTAPIFDGVDDNTLNRGLGRVSGTGKPGTNGNLAIAGHRDGFFRVLKDIKRADLLEVDLPSERDTYSVDVISVVDSSDVSVLQPSPLPTVTLITCYPFYFVGSAPRRFVVKASLTNRELRQPWTSTPGR
jgi:sortase A